jgi:hypothetical protein
MGQAAATHARASFGVDRLVADMESLYLQLTPTTGS